jgi:hypothetical protein
MKFLLLALLLPIAACATAYPEDFGKKEAAALASPDMEAAIRAARPGTPRQGS